MNQIITLLNTWVESQLSSGNLGISSILFLFLGGAIASLLPCTYPLYPITASIIRNRSGESSKWIHPFVYYLGLIFVYFSFGIIAGITGGAFNTLLRLAETNIIISIMIFLLGLSSMDLLFLPIFNPKNTGENISGFAGTFLLGAGAGLLSSPCVGPIVVTILLKITSSTSSISLQQLMVTGFKMLFFGMGVGIPFFLIGVFGLKLPRSGKWMKYIQFTLGGLVLYFSYSFLEKGMLIYGYSSGLVFQFFMASLLVFISTYFLQDENKLPHERVKVSLSLFGVILGSILIFNIANTHSSKPIPTENIVKENTETHGNLNWFRDKSQAYQKAVQTNKKVFVDFYGDWCTNCKKFQELTLKDPELNKALSEVVLLKVIDTDPIFEKYSEDPRFPELKIGLPFFIITDSKEEVIYKTNDYQQTIEMINYLK